MLLWLAVAALCARAAAAPECPARAGAGLCRSVRGARDETQFYIQDKVLIVSLSAGDTLTLKCQGASLDELSALPAFQALEVVRRLRLHACAAPRPALGAVLRALNATLACARADGRLCEVMLGALPPEPALGAALFAGLERLESLVVTVNGDRDAGLRHNASDFLAPLLHLRNLSLTNVPLAEAGLGAPPPALAFLKLTSTGVGRLPPAWLHAPLDELWVDSEQALEVQSVPRAACQLTLLSPATTVSLDAAPALRALTVHHWTERAPRPLAACSQLRELVLTEAAAEVLPAGWLARCSRLERLLLQGGARLHQLPPGLLLGAARLHTLGLRGLGLRALPVSVEGKQLLDPVPDLRDLDLSSNLLSDLPK